MKKTTIITTLIFSGLFSLLASPSFAQVSYQSPFDGTYVGDFKDYHPDNPIPTKTKKIKVLMDHVVLLNTDDTLSQDINVNDLATYVENIDKIVSLDFQALTQSNLIVLQAVFNTNKHVINLAYQNKLNKRDTQIFQKTYQDLNNLKSATVNPNGTQEDIKFELYYNVDTTLPLK